MAVRDGDERHRSKLLLRSVLHNKLVRSIWHQPVIQHKSDRFRALIPLDMQQGRGKRNRRELDFGMFVANTEFQKNRQKRCGLKPYLE
ncbi:hypothetical protein F2P81_008012 [Scophthalmus maximus]|uniref:Uncharacterized protein n=1 Tax=Scophthalmus maximus TaxID=52904 RepID=A0A6A4T151_SCOMX|nr:hypothetical protein F2P81_008012 [Scophthalmus maximus]